MGFEFFESQLVRKFRKLQIHLIIYQKQTPEIQVIKRKAAYLNELGNRYCIIPIVMAA